MELAKRSRNVRYYSGSYFKGFNQLVYSTHPFQSTIPASTSLVIMACSSSLCIKMVKRFLMHQPESPLNHGCFSCGELGHLRLTSNTNYYLGSTKD